MKVHVNVDVGIDVVDVNVDDDDVDGKYDRFVILALRSLWQTFGT